MSEVRTNLRLDTRTCAVAISPLRDYLHGLLLPLVRREIVARVTTVAKASFDHDHEALAEALWPLYTAKEHQRVDDLIQAAAEAWLASQPADGDAVPLEITMLVDNRRIRAVLIEDLRTYAVEVTRAVVDMLLGDGCRIVYEGTRG